jgi:hypothetical protein
MLAVVNMVENIKTNAITKMIIISKLIEALSLPSMCVCYVFFSEIIFREEDLIKYPNQHFLLHLLL